MLFFCSLDSRLETFLRRWNALDSDAKKEYEQKAARYEFMMCLLSVAVLFSHLNNNRQVSHDEFESLLVDLRNIVNGMVNMHLIIILTNMLTDQVSTRYCHRYTETDLSLDVRLWIANCHGWRGIDVSYVKLKRQRRHTIEGRTNCWEEYETTWMSTRYVILISKLVSCCVVHVATIFPLGETGLPYSECCYCVDVHVDVFITVCDYI